MKTKISLLSIVAGVVMVASCSSPATLGYLRDMEYGVSYPAAQAPDLKVQPDDNLQIQVFSTVDSQLAEPFNMGLATTSLGGNPATTYTVSKEGEIEFPVLGTVHVEGKTLAEIRDEISGRINNSGYMKEPIVKVSLQKFSVTVLGETGKSVMDITDNSFNLLQLLARSGGTGTSAKITDVMVIRTENGERKAYSVNLQSKDLFDSPVFYLQQNDIVYLKPKGLTMSTTGSTIVSALQTVFSFITSIAYASWWLNR